MQNITYTLNSGLPLSLWRGIPAQITLKGLPDTSGDWLSLIDTDWIDGVILSGSVTAEGSDLIVTLSEMNTVELAHAIQGKAELPARATLTDSTSRVYLIPLTIRNRAIEGTPVPVAEYYTKAQIDAIIAGITAADIGAIPEPETAGTFGQVLTQGEEGPAWADLPAPPTAPVTSVNGETGAVVLDASDVGAISEPSVAGTTGQVLTKTAEGNAWQNVPAAPVSSVNNKTGAVTLNATDVGALPADTTAADIGALPAPAEAGTTGQVLTETENGPEWQNIPVPPVSSVNNKTGAVLLTASDVGAIGKPSDTGSEGQVLTQTQNGPAWRTSNAIRLGPCSGLGFATSPSGPSFSWIDPDDVVLNGAELARWNQTVLIRKTGTSYPTSPEDGTIMATTSQSLGNKNYYRDHSFADETQEAGTDYSYMLFSQSDNGSWNNLVANQYTSGLGLSWDMVKQYIRAGRGAELFPVGTVFYVDHSEYTHQDSTGLWFRVVGHDQVPPADESLTHSMCLDMVDCLFSAPYDAAELEYALTADTIAQGGKIYYILSGTTYTALTEGTDYEIGDPVPVASWYEKNLANRNVYGSNNPIQNNLINWENSDGSAGNSIQPMTIWDKCNSTLLNKNGFKKYIDPLFLDVVQPAKLTTALCTLEGGGSIVHTAKFWQLSMTQVSGNLNEGITENIHLDYYKNGGIRIKYAKDSNAAVTYRLRSPIVGNAFGLRTINESGNLDNYRADAGAYFSLACIIA